MMDQKLTESLQKWLATPKEQRDYEQGNIYLFRLCGNKIQYRNLAANPSRHAEFISRQIQKYVNFRVREFTHDQVKQMEAQVEKIVEKHLSFEESNPASDFKKGKRADHDSLPEEIQSLYVENLGITQRMRDVQTRLRLLSTEESPCPDSERYPFLQELIALDKKIHDNWERYDHYAPVPEKDDESQTPGEGDSTSAPEQDKEVLKEETTEQSKKAQLIVNLSKGKYKKNPTPELKAKILENYALIGSPSDKLTEELKQLGILE